MHGALLWSLLGPYGSGLEGRPMQELLLWAFRRLLVGIDDKFLAQMVEELTREGTPAGLHTYKHVRCEGQGQLYLQ